MDRNIVIVYEDVKTQMSGRETRRKVTKLFWKKLKFFGLLLHFFSIFTIYKRVGQIKGISGTDKTPFIKPFIKRNVNDDIGKGKTENHY